jgi:hypothetical protein
MLTLSACSDKRGQKISSNTKSLSAGMGSVHFLFSASALDVSFLSLQFSEIALVNAQGQSVIVTPEQGLSVNFATWINTKGLLFSAQVPEGRYVEVHLKVTSESIDMKELWGEELISPSLYSLYGDPVSDKEILVFEQSIDEGFSLLAEENSHAILDISLDIEASHELLAISDNVVERSFSPVFDVSRIHIGSDVSFQMTGELVDVDQSTVTIKTLQGADNKGHSRFSIRVDANTGFIFDGESVSQDEWFEKSQSIKTADSYVTAQVLYQKGIATALNVQVDVSTELYHHEGIRTARQGYIGGVNAIDADLSQKPLFQKDTTKASYPMRYSGFSSNENLPLQSPLITSSIFLFKVTNTGNETISANALAIEQYAYETITMHNTPVELPIASDAVNEDDYILVDGEFSDSGEMNLYQWQYYDNPRLRLALSLPLDNDLPPLAITSDGEIVISDEVKMSSLMELRLFSWPIGLLPEGDLHPIRSIRLANRTERLMVITTSQESEIISQQHLLKKQWIDIGQALIADGWLIKKIDARGQLADDTFIAESITIHLVEDVIEENTDDEKLALLKGFLSLPSHKKTYVVTPLHDSRLNALSGVYSKLNILKLNSRAEQNKKNDDLSNKTAKSSTAKKRRLKIPFLKSQSKESSLAQANDRIRIATLYNPLIGDVIGSMVNDSITKTGEYDLFIKLSKQLHELPPLKPLLTKTDPVLEAQNIRLLQDYVDALNEGNRAKMESSVFHPYFEDGQRAEILSAFKSKPPLTTVKARQAEGKLPGTLNDLLLEANPELTDILKKSPQVYRALFDLQVNYLVKNNFADTKSLDGQLSHMLDFDDKVGFYKPLNKKLSSLEGAQTTAVAQQLKQVNQAFIDFVSRTDGIDASFDTEKIIKDFQSSIATSEQPLLKKYGELTLATKTMQNNDQINNGLKNLGIDKVNEQITLTSYKRIVPPTFADGHKLLDSSIILRRSNSISNRNRKR